MKPWEVLDLLAKDNPDTVLAALAPDDPFWVGASYGVDPFVGMIVRRPLWNPRSYGGGVSADLFDKISRAILDGQLHGDQLAFVLERFSNACAEPEWTNWYRPILKGDLMLPFGLDIYNRHAPNPIQPPALNKPKTSDPLGHLPKNFFIQPAYEDFTFWFLSSKDDPAEVRGYDSGARRIKDPGTEALLTAIGHKQAMDIVVTGYVSPDGFLLEDLLTREQMTRESLVQPLRQRLIAAAKLGFRLVQMSEEFAKLDQDCLKELHLIFQQGYRGVLLRDLEASYPFRHQPDFKITANRLAKVTKALS